MKPTTREWVKKAENDFKVACQILRRRKEIVPDAACFHCQQCVEKYLKARLLEAGIGFPRTHDLLQLLIACLPVEPLWSAYSKVVDGMTAMPWTSATPVTAPYCAKPNWHSSKHCRSLRAEARRSLGLKK